MNFQIQALDESAGKAMQALLDRKTKPTGSLGRLEELSVSLAAMTGKLKPDFSRKVVLVAAADHGVTAQGTSLYPAEVTPQMVLNFLSGGAGINVLARQTGARVVVVDAGVKVSQGFPAHPDFLSRSQGQGTADFSQGPAMSKDQAEAAVKSGFEVASALAKDGMQMLATGDMGIGNTTASSAIAAAILSLPLDQVTGRGTGIDAKGWERKMAVIRKALEVNHPEGKDGLDVLAKVGGFEIGFLAGAVLGAASHRIPVVLDGFISGAAALIAVRLAPDSRHYLLAAHQSVEIGHRHVLESLGLRAYLHLDLRLGEGTGSALFFNLVDASCRVVAEMATFESAGVSDKDAKVNP
jgi:nicotinate-nucleotide--dimethylbenzimidazole phosphoribosyltransferase